MTEIKENAADPAFKEFCAVREKYQELREAQRKKLIEALKKEGFIVAPGNSGKGRKNYTGGGKLDPSKEYSRAL